MCLWQDLINDKVILDFRNQTPTSNLYATFIHHYVLDQFGYRHFYNIFIQVLFLFVLKVIFLFLLFFFIKRLYSIKYIDDIDPYICDGLEVKTTRYHTCDMTKSHH